MRRDQVRLSGRQSLESAIADAIGDVRLLQLVLDEVSGAPRNDEGERSTIVVDEDAFLSWQHVCNHITDSIREVERLFYAGKL